VGELWNERSVAVAQQTLRVARKRQRREDTPPTPPPAPDAAVDDVMPQLLEVITQAAGLHAELPTILTRDSAGGALAIVMALRLRNSAGCARLQ
jgi:acetyl esterase/lipase